MTIKTNRKYTCDGCGETTDRKPAWVRVTVDNTYESNMGLLSTGPDEHLDYCRGCWRKMRAALKTDTVA